MKIIEVLKKRVGALNLPDEEGIWL